ncbi:hypothetical protein IV417_03525 [Alphaproteobacteria bacterium KMM 3653]|uniref:Uncharacterized protein n=1 Tax=Harenicola maris TaxID=2841044 RepID=A0AAP2G7F6_9RHOB|nr:hypothetical protein [Harenicola maris]
MTRWIIECADEDCESCEMSAPSNPKGGGCPRSNGYIVRATVDRSEGDLTFSMSNRSEVRWNKAIFPMLVARQTLGGQLICALCNTVIKTDSDGKISYVSASGKTHVERPPIDHYNKDWKDRRRDLEAKPAFRNADVGDKKAMLTAAFNADPLRITHRTCNLTRPK